MWHSSNITNSTSTISTEALERNSNNSMGKAGPIEKKQKGKLRSGPTNSNNQRRSGTRFSNNPNVQLQSTSMVNNVGVIPSNMVTPVQMGQISQPQQTLHQNQITSYRNTKKIPIDRSKFHPSISNLAGAIIGVSGSNQKWMEQESGAQVQILGTTANDPDGLHIMVRYNEPRELEIVEAIIDEIGRATFEGGGGFISHILPNRKPISQNITGIQNNITNNLLQDHGNLDKQHIGNGGVIGSVNSLPTSYASIQQPIFGAMNTNMNVNFVSRGVFAAPITHEWPKTPPTSPVEFEWLLHLVLHSALTQLGPMANHGVPMIHIPMLYDSFTNFRFEHDATSFFQNFIIQNGLLGLIQAMPHIFIEGPHTIIDTSNIPKLSPIFKVNLASGITPLLLPAQSMNVSLSEFKIADEAYWKMGALPPTFSNIGQQMPQSLTDIYNANAVSHQLQQRSHSVKDSDNIEKEGSSNILNNNKGKKELGINVLNVNVNTQSSLTSKTPNSISEDEGLINEKSIVKNNANVPNSLSSHSSTTTSTSAGTTPLATYGKDNIPQTSLMIVLQGVHFLLRRWIYKKLAPHYIPKSSLDFLPLDILESEFCQFYEVPLNIEILGWTNLLHFVEAFPDVWTVENVGPDEFTLIPLPYPDFSMIAKTRGISKPQSELSDIESVCDNNNTSNICPAPSLVSMRNNKFENIQTIIKQTQDFVNEAISSGYPSNSLEINSINEIIHGVNIGAYDLDSNVSSSLYELVTKITNFLPKYSNSNINKNNVHTKSRFDHSNKGSNGFSASGISKNNKNNGYLQQGSYGSSVNVMNNEAIMGSIPNTRFNSANKNDIRHDLTSHLQHQNPSVVSTGSNKAMNNGSSKRVFSNQCSNNIKDNNNSSNNSIKQIIGQQHSYQYYDQANNQLADLINTQKFSHNNNNLISSPPPPPPLPPNSNSYIQNHGYYSVENTKFQSFNNNATSNHFELQPYINVQSSNSTYIQNPPNHSLNNISYNSLTSAPINNSVGHTSYIKNIAVSNSHSNNLLLSNATNVTSNRSAWDRKTKNKNNSTM